MNIATHTAYIDRDLVAPLAQFTHADLARAGGKGANLGELLRAGFNVPPGFVITTAAYDLLRQTERLRAAMAVAFGGDALNVPVSAERAAAVRAAFMDVPLSERLTAAIRRAYRTLGAGPVAVRSSATAEDVPEASFAGQHETFLNVIGERALFAAVRQCWASLWSERAIGYRARQGLDQSAVKIAVVVQRMVPADVAGVMFTANPVTGAHDEVVIDANPGLGEAVVSGAVTPDHVVIGKYSLRLKEQRSGRREVLVRAKSAGGTEHAPPSTERPAPPALSRATLQQLVRIGRRIERHFGPPQDVEFVWVHGDSKPGQVFIVQARPMTAVPQPSPIRGPMRRMVPMLAEMWPARPYPLDMTTFTGTLERGIGRLLGSLAGGPPELDQAFVEEDGVVIRFRPPAMRLTPRMLIAPWRALWRSRAYDLARWEADPLIPALLRRARALETRDLRVLTWTQNLTTLREALALTAPAMELRIRYFPRGLLALGVLWLVLALARRGDRFGALLSGVETKTTETNRALETLATGIRGDPALRGLFARVDPPELRSILLQVPAGRVFLKDFEAFLAQYGHREMALTISEPAWRDAPEVVLGLLKGLAAAEAQETERDRVWLRTRDEMLTHSLLGAPFVRALFLSVLTAARHFMRLREDTHFYATLAQPIVRRIALELGRRLVEVGALDDRMEVLHLRLEELEPLGASWPPSATAVAQLRALVQRRKMKRASLVATPLFDPGMLAHVSPVQMQGDVDVIVRGTAGSPGIARGPARIVHDGSEFGKVQPGDVLVAPHTNPAWTPLFQRAAAIVVDSGGAASHAAIIAREYGVPAVMGTGNGTQHLHDGQWIQVDGSRGVVLAASENSMS